MVKPKYVIIARTLAHAIATAEIDYGWQRIASRRFIDHEGNEVEAINTDLDTVMRLRGYHFVYIYAGYGFYGIRHQILDEIYAFINCGKASLLHYKKEVKHELTARTDNIYNR